ncbi:alpha/beta hydrolase [Paenibacillus lemnae]|uniref:Alpha/beta hydrolase n=1 Tax=Paenibacillus lemnae TaxID=1330551 RepID=A0A848M876_PAELE|nr:alpha/beta hydrolase [Paenibacillus lemnae]NMO96825.1 alpha/beta hydrolase [Paenibacillus lemnae]
MKLWEQHAPGSEFEEQDTHQPYITPYVIDSDQTHAAVIVFPGGGYVNRAEHEGEPIALWLNSLGLSAFVVHYRVAPVKHPYPLMDGMRAVRQVRYRAAEWNIDPEKIGVLGFSAGGHLAATVCTHAEPGWPDPDDPVEHVSSRPDFAVLCYPVISFSQHRHEGSMISLLGERPSEEMIKLMSGELQVTSETPPTFLWHTADDGAVPVENSLMYASALSAKGVPFELHVFPAGRHGLGLAHDEPHVAQWTHLCAGWLRTSGIIHGENGTV